MRTTLRLTLAAFALAAFGLSTPLVQAQDYLCETNNGTITITRYTGPGGAVAIPDTIGGLPLTSIGSEAFFYCRGLTNVLIPNSVTSIGWGALSYCSRLTSVVIPNSVRTISPWAFSSCSNLSGVYFQGDAPIAQMKRPPFSRSDNVTVYYLPGTMGWRPTFAERPTAFWTNPLISAGSAGVNSNAFGFTISWAPNVTLVVEACPDLAGRGRGRRSARTLPTVVRGTFSIPNGRTIPRASTASGRRERDTPQRHPRQHAVHRRQRGRHRSVGHWGLRIQLVRAAPIQHRSATHREGLASEHHCCPEQMGPLRRQHRFHQLAELRRPCQYGGVGDRAGHGLLDPAPVAVLSGGGALRRKTKNEYDTSANPGDHVDCGRGRRIIRFRELNRRGAQWRDAATWSNPSDASRQRAHGTRRRTPAKSSVNQFFHRSCESMCHNRCSSDGGTVIWRSCPMKDPPGGS